MNHIPTQSKQEAFDLFEQKRKEVLDYARWTARKIAAKKVYVTIDDVREHITLPEGVSGTVFGAVFSNKEDWEFVRYTKTTRQTSHARPIGVYRYIGKEVSFPVTDSGQTQLFAI